jgi:two-component system, OmpR family, copper resistance phosphate regulon response regulator CusR
VRRILIAEEEPRISSFMERGLRESGYATLVAASGPEALRLATSGAFDLLILDLGLPAMDGIEVISALRRRDVRLPVVVVTARPGVREALAGLDGGAVAYLAKPFRFDDLLERIRTLLPAAIAPETV